MFDLFGPEIPLAAKFFIAFAVVLALIGITAWVVRRFGASRLNGTSRGRQPRLAVIDAATVDGRRRLVLIRRDNIEHLLMIGGPTDLVVEPNIVRAIGAREIAREPARAGNEPAVRPGAAAESSWPLQPLNEPTPIAAPRPYRSSATEEPWLAPDPTVRPRPADSLTGMAADLSARLTPPEAPPVRSEPPPRPSVVTPVAPPSPEPVAPSQTDHNLAEMAQQLEAALRRAPMPETSRPLVTDPLAVSAAPPAAKPAPVREFKPRAEPKIEPRHEVKIEAPVEPKPDAKPEPKIEAKVDAAAAAAKKAFDSLEEEMASLLGRPPGKT